MINISEIVATWPVVDGWSISPGVEWCTKGCKVKAGADCKAGDGFQVGNGFRAGDGFFAGDGFRVGNDFRAGDGFFPGNGFRAGDGFQVGNGFWAGDGFFAGDGFRAGDCFRVGNGFRAGDGFLAGNGFRAGDNARAIAALGVVDCYAKSLCAVGSVAYIGAGCRWLTLSDAFTHWGNHPSDRRMTLCLLAAAREMAKLHGLREG